MSKTRISDWNNIMYQETLFEPKSPTLAEKAEFQLKGLT
jgi:hypothetical protein